MNETDVSLKHSTTELSKIGEKLRYARESKRLSQQEVSRGLCLSVSVIDALERDAHEELPAPVFIKGYLKNYAEFLRLPLSAEDIQIEDIVRNTKKPYQESSKHPLSFWLSLVAYSLLKLLNYVIFPVFLLLIFLWWHEKHHAAEKALSITNTTSPISQSNSHLQPIPPDISPWLYTKKGDAK